MDEPGDTKRIQAVHPAFALDGEHRSAGRANLAAGRWRIVRWIVDGAVVAVTLTLGGLALFAPPPATEPAKQTVSTDLEQAMLQPRIAPALPPLPASEPARHAAAQAPADQDKPAGLQLRPPTQSAALAPVPAPEPDAHTVMIDGVTYVAGEEPHDLGTIGAQELPAQ